jgi:hypothetical protein
MPTFELICLANSKKHGGRCVAGLRTDGGGWVRPVGPGEEGVLHPHHTRYTDGSEARVLDVIRVGCTAPRPQIHHPEDWLIDRSRWQRVRRPASSEQIQLLRRFLTHGSMLLGNWNDRVPYDAFRIRPASASLALVAPERVLWAIRTNTAGERRMRVLFSLHGRDYDLPLTDPQWEPRLNRLTAGTHERDALSELSSEDELLLTISLGEPFQVDRREDQHCYKLVAAVIVLPSRNPDRLPEPPGTVVVRTRGAAREIDPSAYPDPFPEFQTHSDRDLHSDKDLHSDRSSERP